MAEAGEIVEANALPSKRFFVNMLVRDIELKDAILDLLDNCVDGILRSAQPDLTVAKPYSDYHAHIEIAHDGFRIIDNCGGIPYQTAIDKAFAIGNPDPIQGVDAAATVGMYGIGMKRAIFKFGENATIRSFSNIPFEVTIDNAWLGSDAWTPLPMRVLAESEFESRGTSVEVRRLYPAVAQDFGRESFVDEVRDAIARQYSIIISKGFGVTVSPALSVPGEASDRIAIMPERFRLLTTTPHDGAPSAARIAPYIYRGEIDGVDVEIYAGLYRELPDEDEQDQEQETSGSADDAGWVVACNDRVVIWKDRSRLTGWGEAGTPNFHGQFIAITGIVLMRSADPSLLPLTTTKRGVDAGSDIYSKIKDLMREATKGLATFTNKWKKFPERLEGLYLGSAYAELSDLRAEPVPMRTVHGMPTMSRSVPTLPTPSALSTDSRVSFAAPKEKVAFLGELYFRDANAKPAKVGEHAFNQEYARFAMAAE